MTLLSILQETARASEVNLTTVRVKNSSYLSVEYRIIYKEVDYFELSLSMRGAFCLAKGGE
ncbi:MAG: hypothetical protein NPIRA01_00090 [Nitrospirales bacterium]|nr:MAG: hypothetical protein NPIRA01_00090 [Nitrospirales bacterium]